MLPKRSVRALLRRYGATLVAKRCGVVPSTVRKWIKAGRYPASREAAIRSLGEIQLPGEREVKKALQLSPQLLAQQAGVTERTARKWRKQGSIPQRYRVFLVVDSPQPKPRRLRGEGWLFEGKHTRGFEALLELEGAELDEVLRVDIIRWLEGLKVPPLPSPVLTYQIVATGNCALYYDEDKPPAYLKQVTEVLVTDDEEEREELYIFPTVVSTRANRNRTEAILEFDRLLRQSLDKRFEIDQVTFWARYSRKPV